MSDELAQEALSGTVEDIRAWERLAEIWSEAEGDPRRAMLSLRWQFHP